MERLARCALVLALVGCAHATPPTVPAEKPEDVSERFMETSLIPEVPAPKMNFGAASCYLWNPNVEEGDAFFVMVIVNGERQIRRAIISDPQTATILVQLFLSQGTPLEGIFNGVTGWLAVCKPGDTPKRSSVYARL